MKQELKTNKEHVETSFGLARNKGITLVALIITIIVLLILAVVAISAVSGNGILNHAQNAKTQYSEAQQNEQEMLAKYEYELEKSQGKVQTYGEYVINKELNEKYPGLKLGDQINYIVDGYTSMMWNVIGIENGELLLAGSAKTETMMSNSSDSVWDEQTKSFKTLEEKMNEACQKYLNTQYATKARNMTMEDVNKITGYDKTTYVSADGIKYGDKVTYKLVNGKINYKINSGEYTETSTPGFKAPLAESKLEEGEEYEVENTYFSYDAAEKCGISKESKLYKIMFENTGYYLSSSAINAINGGYANFSMGYISGSKVQYNTIYNSVNMGGGIMGYLRPVVQLKSDIELVRKLWDMDDSGKINEFNNIIIS